MHIVAQKGVPPKYETMSNFLYLVALLYARPISKASVFLAHTS